MLLHFKNIEPTREKLLDNRKGTIDYCMGNQEVEAISIGKEVHNSHRPPGTEMATKLQRSFVKADEMEIKT